MEQFIAVKRKHKQKHTIQTVATLRGGGGGGLPRVSPFWGDTILWYKSKSNKKENNNIFNSIENAQHWNVLTIIWSIFWNIYLEEGR